MRCWGRDSPAAHGVDHGGAAVPLEVHRGAPPPAAPGGSHARARGCPKEAVILWKPVLEQDFWQDLGPQGGSTLEQFVKTCSPWKSSWRTVCHGRDTMLEQRKSVRCPSPEEERVADTTYDEGTTAPISHTLVLLGGGGRENLEWS